MVAFAGYLVQRPENLSIKKCGNPWYNKTNKCGIYLAENTLKIVNSRKAAAVWPNLRLFKKSGFNVTRNHFIFNLEEIYKILS